MTRQNLPPLAGVRSNPAGFTLIATILLMVLLGLLAVGMLSLSAVSLRTGSAVSADAQARANAKMALMVAIGELQEQLGPDRRISMAADQRTAPGGDGSQSSSAVGNRYWTGVYDSWAATSVDRPTPVFRSWLVSGNSTSVVLPAFPETALSGSGAVELVGEGTAGPDAAKHVKVPAVDVTGGRMAWWVGDQGVKAALATPTPSTDTSLGAVRNGLQSAPRNAIELASAGAVKPFEAVESDDERLPRLTSWKQTEHLVTDVTTPLPLFHDLTAFSTGLLTNVRAGGFRKDLSMKMETYTSPPDLSDPKNVFYTARSSMTGHDEVGINFLELWSYYNLYKQLNYGGGGNYTTGGSIPSSVGYLQTANTLEGVSQDYWDWLKHPVTINYQAVLSFEMAPDPANPAQKLLWLCFDPVITLWNPLDVPVNVRPSDGLKNYMYVYWLIPYDIRVKVNGGAERQLSLIQSINSNNDANILRMNAGRVETLTLKPGEVLKISQTGGTISYQRASGMGSWDGLDGRKGFNYGGGIRVPLRDAALNPVVLNSGDSISYRATPNNRGAQNGQRFATTLISKVLGSPWGKNIHLGQISIDHWTGYSRAKVGESRNRSTPIPNPSDVLATNPSNSGVFPTIEGPSDTRVLSASEIGSNKAPFMIHSYNVKTEEEGTRGTRAFARFNPKALSVNFYNVTDAERDMLPYEPSLSPLTSWLNAPLDESFDGQGFFGSSLGAQFGSNFVVTHGVPRQPIVSLGALQNSFANGFNRITHPVSQGSGDREHAMALLPLMPQISHAIGNSLAPSVMPSDKTTSNRTGNPLPLADHSYLANRELWDDYFFSGITPQPTPAFTQARDQKTVALEFFENQKDLPVVRYLPVLDDREADELVASWFSGSTPTQNSIRDVASHLRVDGMFNVNSTSVEAWKAVLGSLKGRPIVVRDEAGVESIKAADGNTPVVNLGAPRDVVVGDDAAMDPEQWYGRRTLTGDEIDSLARGIVKEVRKRGPFLSLSDFVNRRVGTDRKLARAGAIQSALDSTAVTTNDAQNSGREVTDFVKNRFEFPEAEGGAMHYGAPSLVKQGDILTPIAPVLSARSDSFIIRAYGEATDAQGNVLAQAWCEATVERDRNYVDRTDEPTVEATNLTRQINRTFGREFVLVSFRWLNPREI